MGAERRECWEGGARSGRGGVRAGCGAGLETGRPGRASCGGGAGCRISVLRAVCCSGGFRADARCRPEVGAPSPWRHAAKGRDAKRGVLEAAYQPAWSGARGITSRVDFRVLRASNVSRRTCLACSIRCRQSGSWPCAKAEESGGGGGCSGRACAGTSGFPPGSGPAISLFSPRTADSFPSPRSPDARIESLTVFPGGSFARSGAGEAGRSERHGCCWGAFWSWSHPGAERCVVPVWGPAVPGGASCGGGAGCRTFAPGVAPSGRFSRSRAMPTGGRRSEPAAPSGDGSSGMCGRTWRVGSPLGCAHAAHGKQVSPDVEVSISRRVTGRGERHGCGS